MGLIVQRWKARAPLVRHLRRNHGCVSIFQCCASNRQGAYELVELDGAGNAAHYNSDSTAAEDAHLSDSALSRQGDSAHYSDSGGGGVGGTTSEDCSDLNNASSGGESRGASSCIHPGGREVAGLLDCRPVRVQLEQLTPHLSGAVPPLPNMKYLRRDIGEFPRLDYGRNLHDALYDEPDETDADADADADQEEEGIVPVASSSPLPHSLHQHQHQHRSHHRKQHWSNRNQPTSIGHAKF